MSGLRPRRMAASRQEPTLPLGSPLQNSNGSSDLNTTTIDGRHPHLEKVELSPDCVMIDWLAPHVRSALRNRHREPAPVCPFRAHKQTHALQQRAELFDRLAGDCKCGYALMGLRPRASCVPVRAYPRKPPFGGAGIGASHGALAHSPRGSARGEGGRWRSRDKAVR
jgi:hypothetical protein